MSTPIQPGDRPVAITATWVVTVGPGWTIEALSDRCRRNPLGMLSGLDVTERTPVQVSARPAHDLKQPDTAVEPAAPGDRPPPPDLFFGPELAAEALRRIARADRAHALWLSLDAPSVTTYDGHELGQEYAAGHAKHMLTSAAVLMKAADIAARLAPDFSDEAAWTAALSAVEALTPPPDEEQADEEQMDELTKAVRAGADKAWAEHHQGATDTPPADEDLREAVHGLLSGLGVRAREARQQGTTSDGDEPGDGAR